MKGHKLKKKILIIGGIVAIVIATVVLILLCNINTIVKKGVEKAGTMILKAPVTLDRVKISFFSGSGMLEGFTIGNPEGYKTDYAFKINKLNVKLDVGSVTSDKIHIKNIFIDSPKIVYEGSLAESNIKQLQNNAMAFTGTGGSDNGESGVGENPDQDLNPGAKGKKLQIDHIKIQNGTISVSIGILKGKKLTIPLPTIELKDIGKEKDANISDVLEEILGSINKVVIPSIKSGVTNFEKTLKGKGGNVKEGIQKGIDKIKGLFKK